MKITAIREAAIPINSTLRNAVFDFSEMTTSVVAVITDVMREGKPVAGFAFNSTGRYACGAQMRERFIPRILKADPKSLVDASGENFDPEKILACMMQREKPGGHTERSVAIGTIEVACWDAVAKIAGKPLHAVLAERYNGGRVQDKVQCYVGGGWYEPGKGLKELQDEIRARLDQDYTTMKIKVGGAPASSKQGSRLRDANVRESGAAPPSAGVASASRVTSRKRVPVPPSGGAPAPPEDVKRVEAALEIVGSSDRLAVDANAGFDRARALSYALALKPYKLRWFEEPTDPLDFALLADVASVYDSPIGTGENLFSTQDVENLVRFSGLRADRDIIQIDVPQSYGIVQFSRTLEMLKRHGWERHSIFPHGGNQMTLAIVGGFGLGGCEAYPGVFGIFAGFADDAKVENGYLTLPERPGIGFEAQNALYAVMRDLAAAA